ncbi:MAG: aspartyl protease family protein [candidate division Zixibacteria bacterium]|nr:aspartyl protease family protein [candidate division Zixibacteria bacterium]
MSKIFFAFLVVFAAAASQAQVLNEILAKHTEAMGGLDKMRQIATAEFDFSYQMGGMTGTAKMYYKSPDRVRYELDLPLAAYTQACSGDDCWMSDKSGLTHSLGAEYKALLITQLALTTGSYLDPAAFVGQVSLVAPDRLVDSVRCCVIEIAPTGGLAAQLAINKQTYLIYQTVVDMDLATIISTYFDYRAVDGVMVPFRTIERTEAGLVAGSNEVLSAKFNQPIDNALFRDPRAGTEALTTIKSDSVIVPFEFWNNHAYVEVNIDDRRKHYFIFDSGAGGSAINARLVDSLNVSKLADIEAHGVGGAQQTPAYKLDRLVIGTLEFVDLPVFAVDLSAIEQASNRTIDGIIGYDVLSRCIVSIDYDKKLLVLYSNATAPRASWGDYCDLTIDFHLPYVAGKVNDSIPGLFRIDTGSGSTIDFNSPFVQRNRLIGGDRSQYQEIRAVGIGGGSTGLMGVLPAIELCGRRVDSLLVNFSTSSAGIFSGEHTAGNIGAGLLKRFRVTFDYANEKLYLAPLAGPAPALSGFERTGLTLRSQNDTVFVDAVRTGSAAAGLIEPGDQLLSVNATSTVGTPLAEVEQQLVVAPGDSVNLKIRRGERIIKVRLILDSAY